SGRDRRVRPGIEEMLAKNGLEYFVADAHLVSASQPLFLYRDFLPLRKDAQSEPVATVPAGQARSPYLPYRAASRGGRGQAVAFFRDPKTTLPVWSREHGSPGEHAYLACHQKHCPGGMERRDVPRMTLGEALESVPPRTTLSLPEGSWGEGGDHRVWLNRGTEWTWDRIYSAEAEWVGHLARLDGRPEVRRVITQATRELLLLQSSDWQFLITTGTASDYAERRVAEHYAEFKRLCEMARPLEAGDTLSPDPAHPLE